MARSRVLPPLGVLAALLATASCDRGLTGAGPAGPTPALRHEMLCRVTVASGELACAQAAPAAAQGGARAIILGGQNTFVRLASSNNTYVGTTFSIDVTVQNLIPQPLGTRDGATPDPDGVRVFFASEPTSATGVVAIANEDGRDLFLSSEQPFFRYDEVLGPRETSAARPWRFTVPNTVTSFQFRVYVAAEVPHPRGWLAINPDLVDVPLGGARTLAATAHDIVGRPVAVGAVTWRSADTAIARVDAAGVVTGRQAGQVAIVADNGVQADTLDVGVVTGGDVTPPEIRSFSIAPARVDVTQADAALEVMMDVADARSDVTGIQVLLNPPAGAGGTSRQCGTITRESGTAQSGLWKCTVTVPRSSAEGSWTLGWIAAADALGNTRQLRTPQMQAAGFATTVEVTSGTADTTPPSISAFSFSPDSVDVSTAAATLELRLAVQDARSGVAGVQVLLTPPAGAGGTVRQCGTTRLVSGTAASGVWGCTVTLPVGSAEGTWTFGWITAADALGNARQLLTPQMQEAGFRTGIRVRSAAADTQPPAITAFSFSPASVGTASADARVEVTMQAADAGSGVAGIQVLLNPPAGAGNSFRQCGTTALESGTAQNGVWKCTVTLPQGSAEGVWTFGWIMASDALGNARQLQTSQMQTAGFATAVEVTSGTPDTAPPAITSFSFAPSAVNVASDTARVEVLVGVQDAGSDVVAVAARLEPPAGSGAPASPCGSVRLVSGTARDGVWGCTLTLPTGSAAGSWTFAWIEAADRPGNTKRLDTAALLAAGYGTAVQVTR